MKNSYRALSIALALCLAMMLAVPGNAQEAAKDYELAKKEIIKTMGHMPSFFDVMPKHALPGAWNYFKSMTSEKNLIPPKYRELLQLAVAAQIPCQYCVYFHTASAQAFGASDDEVHEAIAHGAQTRHWSMILQGNQIDYESFKQEFQDIMSHMAKQAEK